MSNPWAVRLAADQAAQVGRLRGRPGIQVLQTDGWLWLRGEELDEDCDHALRAVPGAHRFTVLPDWQLVPAGRRVPEGSLPEGPWTGLGQWMGLALEVPAEPANPVGPVRLRWVRRGVPRPPNLLVTTLPVWRDWAVRAAEVRLARLAFAASREAEVVIRGTPVPPIRGRRFVERAGVAVEGSWTWCPPLEPEVVRQALGLAPDDLALLHPDGTWDHVPAEAFVHATRSAVRLSAQGAPDDAR